jgi:hypothetical protein
MGKVDVLTPSPIWTPDEGIENFAQRGAARPSLRDRADCGPLPTIATQTRE